MGPATTSSLSVAAGVAGFLAGAACHSKLSGRKLRRQLNGNTSWMSDQERQLAAALITAGHGHLFSGWPRPGVKDGAKRALLTAAHSYVTAGVPTLEIKRLGALQAPVAAKHPKVLEAHGDVRSDPYYWLRDDKRKSRAVLDHLTAENAHTQAVMADTKALQEELYQEMRGRIQEADQTVPVRRSGYYYYTRTLEGQQYKVHCRRRVLAGVGPPTETETMDEAQPEEVLFDENKRKADSGFSFYMVGSMKPSPDGKLLAWTEDTKGGERYTLRVKDIASGQELMKPIVNVYSSVEWAADNQHLFFVTMDPQWRPYKVWRHRLGQPGQVAVYEEEDEAFCVGIGKSRSEKLLFISSESAVTSEERYIYADQPTSEFTIVMPRVTDVQYSVYHHGQHLFATLRDSNRPNSEVLLFKMSDLEARRTTEAKAVQSAVANAEAAGSQGDFDSPVLRLIYTSLTTPVSTIDYNMATGTRATKKVNPVLGGFKQEDYETERVWATSHDGVKVPISIVYKKGQVKLNGIAPLLLDGYGSYEVCNDPWFSANRLCYLDRGFVYAIAHVRGGGEMGRAWYEDGKYLRKKNTFLDFIACAEHLIKNKYTSQSRLAIDGRSAGGLLIAAVCNMRPDLFHAAVLGVPFVDVVTTISDETIPLTVIEWEEWGNPSNFEYYHYIKSYSPVDNVRHDLYPHMLVTGGLHDPRVGYWEPAKLVAKLRDQARPGNMLLLKLEMGAGHFSVTGRFEVLREEAFEVAFVIKALSLPRGSLE